MLRCLLIVMCSILILATPGKALGTGTTHEWRWDECRMNAGSSSWTSREVRQVIRCAVAKWPVSGGVSTALSVAACESGSDLQDWNASDGYAGPMQQAVRYWPGRRSHYRPRGWELQRSPAQPRSNVIVSIRMAHGSGWSAWSCA